MVGSIASSPSSASFQGMEEQVKDAKEKGQAL